MLPYFVGIANQPPNVIVWPQTFPAPRPTSGTEVVARAWCSRISPSSPTQDTL